MRIFLAGATGVVGRRLAMLLSDAGHEVTGTTRTSAKLPMLRALGIVPIVVDVFDADALMGAVATARRCVQSRSAFISSRICRARRARLAIQRRRRPTAACASRARET